MKIMKHRCKRDVRKYSFTSRVVDLWNNLPEDIVTAKSVHQFENRLDRYWEDHPLKYNYLEEYRPYTGKKNTSSTNAQLELPIEDQEGLRAEST